jgi:hypothetical protein
MIDNPGKEEGGDELEHLDVQKTIARCDELSLLGQYKSALDLLGPLIEDSNLAPRELVQVLRATAHVFVLRGYPRIAKECLENALGLPSDQLEKQQLLMLNVHHAFIAVVGCGEELPSDECLRQARDWLESLEVVGALESQAVSLANVQYFSCSSASLILL